MGHMPATVAIETEASAFVEAWRCIGCGRIEAPRPCIGICEDRRVRLVDAVRHETALLRLRDAEARAATLEGLVRRLAQTRPRAGAWEQSYRALQDEAQVALAVLSLARSAPAASSEARTIEP
jgi:hypothetical protein